jgi:hypothetical protein
VDKLSIITSQDAATLEQTIEAHIERIRELQEESTRLELEERDNPDIGAAVLLRVRESVLQAQVLNEFNGQRSNETMRDARLCELKSTDEDYSKLAREVHSINTFLARNKGEIAYLGYKFQAAMQSLRYKRAILNFLAEGD